MNRNPVNSSNLKSVGYDPETMILEVEFKGGGVYQYKGVEVETHSLMTTSESIGRFFNQNIKNKFETIKQNAVEADKTQEINEQEERKE